MGLTQIFNCKIQSPHPVLVSEEKMVVLIEKNFSNFITRIEQRHSRLLFHHSGLSSSTTTSHRQFATPLLPPHAILYKPTRFRPPIYPLPPPPTYPFQRYIPWKKDTVSEGTKYKLSLSFPSDYPLKPPKDKSSWAYDVRTILISVQSLLGEPNISFPLNSQVAQLWSN
ncbi:hypothetical protein Patl1_14096 [Pistacia atlantica]|uniref:Uncharacterized protein n=1 Tax=Pistacia atlantica TaxID=434234 RepID=A0ACC1ATM4_9ROSI|nr:hypothetical protein Patl1_14096 [Pistacia atlantica]